MAFLLAQVGHRSAQEFARLLKPLKLQPADAGILRLLSLTPGVSQQQLARRLGMHASRLVAILDALEGRGLLIREPHERDRRLYSLRLTAKGGEMMKSLGQAARAHNDLMTAGLDAAERDTIASLLERIAAHHGLVPGIHPGYKELRPKKESR